MGYPKMDISHWDAAIHYGIQLPQYCDQTRSFNAISPRSPHLCSLALRLRNTKVPVWTHESIGYPKMDISHWDAAIHYCVQLAQYCDQTRSLNAISRRSPPVYSLALRLRNPKVPVLTHESIWYPKMDISHWDAAIHYGVQLAQYCDQTLSCNAISPRSPPLCSHALRLRNTKVPVLTHESKGYPKMDISHWDAAIHYGIQLAQYCDQTRSFNAISPRSPPLCSLALRLRNTKVPVWTHESIGYPKMDISHWDAAIHYGVQLAQYCDQTRSFNAISRRSPPVYSLALRLRNTKLPVLTHESIWFPKMDISHWDAAIHYGVQLAQYCDQTLSCNAISRRSSPLCSLALRLRNTKVPVLTHESKGYPKMDISHWDAAIHYGIQLAQYCDQTRSFNAISRRSPPLCSLALRLRNTKVPVWTHESIGYPKIDISHWDAAIHSCVQLAKYCDQTRSLNAISRRSPPVYSLALRLRNPKVPVLTHESIGYPRMDISHWDAAIHYGVQLAQYCNQTRSFKAISRRSPPVYSLDLRLRNTKVPVLTHESIGYPKMDISHWDAAIHCCIQLAQYCDQTRSLNAISRRSPPVFSLALRLRNPKVPVLTHESIRYPKMDISHWDAAIHYGIQLAQYCDQTRSFNAISPRSPPLCSLALRLRNTKVPVWTHESEGYLKMDISHWDAAIHFGMQLAQYCDQTRSFNAISRRSPTVYSLALRLRNPKVPVLTHESIWYPKMDISHWDAAIHYGVQLAQYCDQTLSCNAISPRSSPLCSLALRLRNTKVSVLTHESKGYPKMDISHWDAAIHYGIQLAQYCDQTRSFNTISWRSPPLCSLALRLRNTKVPVWTHESIGYPKMDISHWDAAIHYGVQLAQYCDQTRSFNAISRRSPPVYSLALRLRNTKLPVLTHESIWFPKMDISHWDAAIHYGVQLAQYCDQTLSCNAISRRSSPLCSLALRLRNTKVPVLTHESIGYPKMDISHWDAAIHYGIQLAQYCDQTRSFNAISPRSPPLCSLALRLRNTKVPVLTHESIGYPKMDISHWDAAIHFGIQLAQYCDQTRSFNATLQRSPPVYFLALRLRNTKVPVWSHESIGYPKMDISHWDAAIHYGVQLAQYCNQTRSFKAISRRSPPVYSLALRLRNTKVPVLTHESIGYPEMDISHWDAAIHYCVQLAQYCDQTRSLNAIPRRSPPVYSLALRLRNPKVPVLTHESIGYLKMDIIHWDAAIHYGIQLAQYCDQTRSFNAISPRSPPVYSLALRLRNTKVPVLTHESIGYPEMDISHWDAAIHYGV